jgi:rhodanese-related sulfurtransferase
MKSILAEQFAQLVKRGFADDELGIDVREPFEWEEEHIESMLHMPMQEVPIRHTELDQQKKIYVLCAHGVRSEKVSQYLEQKGFQQVVNVAGGLAEVKKHL